MTSYFSASQVRNSITRQLVEFYETKHLEEAILLSAIDGSISVIVTDSTMTSGDTGREYFSVWKGDVIDDSLNDHMNQVIKYFNNSGYKIIRKLNTTTTNTFQWEIFW